MYINYNENTKRITNMYYGDESEINQSDWVEIDQSIFPTPTVGDTEYPVYFYDPNTKDVTAEIKTMEGTQ